MTTRPEDLRPSSARPIRLETLMKLPLGGIYLWSDATEETWTPIKITGWTLALDTLYRIRSGGEWTKKEAWRYMGGDVVRYPKLSRVAFSMTTDAMSTPGDQPSGRMKSATRRKPRRGCPHCGKYLHPVTIGGVKRIADCPEHGVVTGSVPLPPAWAKPGHLFLAIDKGRRSRSQPESRGLGVFRVESAKIEAQYACDSCGTFTDLSDRTLECSNSQCGMILVHSTITPAELALEGLPDMDPDDFWQMLEKHGNVDADGYTCRVAFEEVR